MNCFSARVTRSRNISQMTFFFEGLTLELILISPVFLFLYGNPSTDLLSKAFVSFRYNSLIHRLMNSASFSEPRTMESSWHKWTSSSSLAYFATLSFCLSSSIFCAFLLERRFRKNREKFYEFPHSIVFLLWFGFLRRITCMAYFSLFYLLSGQYFAINSNRIQCWFFSGAFLVCFCFFIYGGWNGLAFAFMGCGYISILIGDIVNYSNKDGVWLNGFLVQPKNVLWYTTRVNSRCG